MAILRSHFRTQATWLAMMDLACLVAAAVFAVLLRFGAEDILAYVFGHVDGWLLLFGSIIVANYLAGAYRIQFTFSRFNMLVIWAFSLTIALLFISVVSYAWFRTILGRGVLLLTILSYSLMSLGIKLAIYHRIFRSNFFVCRTVIVGQGLRAQRIREALEHSTVLPVHRVVAYIDIEGYEGANPTASAAGRASVVRIPAAALRETVQHFKPGLLVVGLEDLDRVRHLYPQLKRMRFEGLEVLLPLDVAEIYAGKTPVDLIGEEDVMRASLENNIPAYRRFKRLIDLVFATFLGLLLFPVGVLVAVVIKLSEPRHPVFYRQVRVGQFGAVFNIFKFRTMRPDAEAETGPVWSEHDDPRVTRLGRVLRKFRLDEIPQLWNVFLGNMSLVGPRPERPEMTRELAEAIAWYEERENVIPGITGWAQVQYPYGSSVDDARHKLEYDLYYIKHMSFTLDIQIILRTLRIILFGLERAQ